MPGVPFQEFEIWWGSHIFYSWDQNPSYLIDFDMETRPIPQELNLTGTWKEAMSPYLSTIYTIFTCIKYI